MGQTCLELDFDIKWKLWESSYLKTQATKWVLISILHMSPFRAKLRGLIVLSSSRPIKQGANFKTLDSKTCSHGCSGTKSHILMRKSLKTLKWPTENIGNELHYRLTYRLVEHATYYGPLNSLFWNFCSFFVHHDTMFHITQWCLIPAWIMHNLHMASQLCILIKSI
jgi:hypothetical protein